MLPAQAPGLLAGVAIPGASSEVGRTAGPALAGSVLLREYARVRPRADFEGLQLRGSDAPTLRVLGATAFLELGPGGDDARPYVLVGAGVHRLTGARRGRPRALAAGLALGAGATWPLPVASPLGGGRRLRLITEVRTHALFSDFGEDGDYVTLTHYWPLVLGLRL